MTRIMERFNELKEEILRRAHEARACREEYGRAYKAETLDDLMQVIQDNFQWCCCNNVVDGALIDAYKEEFNAGKIWHNESFITEGFILMDGDSRGELYGNSYGYFCDNSCGELHGNSYGYFRDNSCGELHGNSRGELRDNSYAISCDIKECELHDQAIYRIIYLNEVRYADETMKFVKVKEGE